MPQHDCIRIKNASFYAYHGVASDEQTLGGKFEVDVDLRTDFSAAVAHDSLKQAVDYEAVYAAVSHLVTAKKYFLLESLARSIAGGILELFPSVHDVTVRVRKPHPPVKGVVDYVEVEVQQHR